MTDHTEKPWYEDENGNRDENLIVIILTGVQMKKDFRAKLQREMGWDRAGTRWSAADQRAMLKDIWTHVGAYRQGVDDWIRGELEHGRLPTHAGHHALVRS